MKLKKRRPWVAGLLGVALPGLGQVYNGQLLLGMLLFVAVVVVAAASIMILLYLPLAPLNVLLPLLLFAAFSMSVLVHAVVVAHRAGEIELRPYNRWYIYLGAIGAVGFGLQPVAEAGMRNHVSQAFTITSVAMEPTLQVGDYILVSKGRYRKANPSRFDMVVFRLEDVNSGIYIQRVVGVPGDTLAMVDKQLFLGGTAVDEPYVTHRDPIDVAAPAMEWQRGFLIDLAGAEVYKPTRDNWGPIGVPEGHYFVLGDNRDDSWDSRYYGFVPVEAVVAGPQRLYFSWDDHQRRARWDRVGLGW